MNALVVVDVQDDAPQGLPGAIKQHIETQRPELVIFTVFGEGAVHPLLAPYATESQVFQKRQFSAFRAPGFLRALKKQGITKLWVCGLDTEACVYATAIDGIAEGFDVHVLTSLCASRHGRVVHEKACDLITQLWKKPH
ncbi:MAG: cysteine hydrolase [Nanoarchaeota archaeon]|nr:cysteine hydrolase [Nanoarchaeota archaeon]